MSNYSLKLDWKASICLEKNGTGKCSFWQVDLKKRMHKLYRTAYSSNQGKGVVANANLIIYIQVPYLYLTLLRRSYSWKPVCTHSLQSKNNHQQSGFRGSCFFEAYVQANPWVIACSFQLLERSITNAGISMHIKNKINLCQECVWISKVFSVHS